MTEQKDYPERQTYLPIPRDLQLYQYLFARDYEYLDKPIATKYPYERVGFDRLLAIINDMELNGLLPPASVLDVGCNIGLFSLGLANIGYQVVGVDSNVAADVQGFYPEKILDLANALKGQLRITTAEFIDLDIELFVEHDKQNFDVCLLLSVVHQWFAGYALSGIEAKPLERVEAILQNLVCRTTRIIYYEGPEETHPVYHNHIDLLDWFGRSGLARQITPLSVSPSAEGDLRTLYRIGR